MQKLTNRELIYNSSTREISTTYLNAANKPKGTELINRLISSKRTVTITIGYEGNKEMDANPRNASNGIGTDTTVKFDPTSNPAIMTVDPKTGRVSRQRGRPNQIGLGHELIHAERSMRGEAIDYSEMGIIDYKDVSGQKATEKAQKEEFATVGLKYNKSGDITENQLRREQGQPRRGAYSP